MLRLVPVEQHRTHQYIADQLRREITLGLVLAGDALPSERELARLLGVGRSTVQDAVELLEGEGFVTSRRGRNGGTFVVHPARTAVTERRLIARVRRDRELIAEAVAFRLEVEPAAAAGAAVGCSAESLGDLTQIARLMATSDNKAFTKLDARFHVTIARQGHNRLLAESVERAWLVLHDAITALPGTESWFGRARREHEALLEALRRRDPGLARRRARAHVERSARGVAAMIAAL